MDYFYFLIYIGLHFATSTSTGSLPSEYSSVKQSSMYSETIRPSRALDNDTDTFILTKRGYNESWTVTFNKTRRISCLTVVLKGGSYVILVRNPQSKQSVSECMKLILTNPSRTYYHNACCSHELSGIQLEVVRLGQGVLRLFEVIFKGCDKGQFGIDCKQCSNSCFTCDAANGSCKSCIASRYGEKCDFECPQHCSNGNCNFESGECSSCESGNTGPRCDQCKRYGINDIKMFTTWGVSDDFSETIRTFKIAVGCLVAFIMTVFVIAIIIVITKKSRKTRRTVDGYEVIVLQEFNEDSGSDYDALETVEYMNIISNRVSVDQLMEDVEHKKIFKLFKEEFMNIPSGPMDIHSASLHRSNRRKNRYKKVFPYDNSRVVLQRPDDSKQSDYINASYIQGYEKEKAYIAAQGPFTEQTREDFWTMVWQNNSTRIVMLTRLSEGNKTECMQYWPDVEDKYGFYTVKMERQYIYKMYTIRRLQITKGTEEKHVIQFHFTEWLKLKVPESPEPLLSFRKLIKSTMSRLDGPIIVHCSAGIGRTGTFIALDYLLEEGIAKQSVDVTGFVARLRQQRAFSIQSCDEYVFLHEALAEGLKNNQQHIATSAV